MSSQTSLEQALDLNLSLSPNNTLNFCNDLCIGQAALGGYVTGLLQKVALKYAAQHPIMKHLPDVRSSTSHYFRPVFPAQGAFEVRVQEVHVGKMWSMLRVELFQGSGVKLCISVDFSLTNFELPGRTLDTRWQLLPPPPTNDFVKANSANTVDNPNSSWTTYHLAFYPNGFRRAHSYIKYFIPKKYSPTQSYDEQWVVPGWDCLPTGSRDPSVPEARWTTEMLPVLLDLNLPSQSNYIPREDGAPFFIGSTPSTLEFATRQHSARVISQRPDWRHLGTDGDGSAPNSVKMLMARGSLINVTISMNVEVKKRLPEGGVRWLYLRGEIKWVRNGSMDWQVLCFDGDGDLVAVRNSVETLLEPGGKNARVGAKKGKGPEKL